MIDKSDTRKDRRWLPSFSISGRLGSRRFDNLASAAAAILVVVVILAPACDAQTCSSVIQSQVDCLFAPAPRGNVITIDCATAYYRASTTSAAIYQAANSGAGCPSSAPVNTTAIGACYQSNTASCSSASTSSTCFYAVNTPSSSVSGTTCTGPYFVVTTYQCLPVASTSNTTTSTATSMDNPKVTSNVEVTIANPSPVNNINFFGPTNYSCSIYVPAGLEVIFGYRYLTKSNPDCRWRVEISDVTNRPVAVICNSTSPQRVSLGCGSDPTAPQYFALRYIGDSSSSIFFGAFFQVRQQNNVTVQCGYPPFPLYSTPPPASTTIAPTTPPATAQRTTTPPPPAVTSAAVAASTAAISTPTPSTPVFSTPALASTNPPAVPVTTNPPAVPVTTAAVAPSTAAISTPTPSTTALPTPAPASTNPPAAPATSNAVTSGAPTTGGVTTAAPSPAVTTAQPNNVPTTALPLVSPTTASPPAAPDTSAAANAITSGAVPSTSPTSLRTISINGSVQTVTPSAGGVSSGWDMNATIGVVVGSVVAGAIVLAIVAAVALWRRSVIATAITAKAAAAAASTTNPPVTYIEPVSSTNYQLDAQAYNAGPYRNVTGFYVDGTSRSNLVISRPTPPPPPQPFKTVLRLQ